MNAYGNLHVAFEQMRVRALGALNGSPPPPDTKPDVNAEPPRVLILGPETPGRRVCARSWSIMRFVPVKDGPRFS